MQDYSNIRCIAFDLDDTLWPCEPTITHAEQALYVWLQENYPRITQGYSFNAIKRHRMAFGQAHPELAHDVTALRHQSLLALAREFNYSNNLADEGLALFREFRNQVIFFDDAFTTLEELKKHYKIGAITNGNADLKAIGVSEKFDFVVTAEKAGVAKPNKGIFQYAQQQAQADSSEMMLVGDAPLIDVIGAKKSGWQAIWYNPNKQKWIEEIKPNAEIQALSQLLGLMLN